MDFHKSSMNIHLRDRHVLCAYCQRPSGEATYSELDLDSLLGTVKGKQDSIPWTMQDSAWSRRFSNGLTRGSAGKFKWSAENFSGSASNITLVQEGPMHEPILHVQLDDGDGPYDEYVNLAYCIKNEDGKLKYMDCF